LDWTKIRRDRPQHHFSRIGYLSRRSINEISEHLVGSHFRLFQSARLSLLFERRKISRFSE
jgi:hypothetical protein